ncbi:MAG: sugar phosphate isomerase/epimerase [Kiritimatiellae bacterium]|nr:sugar phosphate isomerase/epimerase [Verrucomicrobiota bacterium]MCG2681318.1 sugar phosphate isomerase/epimerase [Kiritimatiellia bacterium]
MNLSVSSWNYLQAYGADARLFTAIDEITVNSFGVELWLDWSAEPGIIPERKEEIRTKLAGVNLSAHTALKECDFEKFKAEIDLCAYIGARALVVHVNVLGDRANDINAAGIKFAQQSVDYASTKAVAIALENGSFSALAKVMKQVCGLKACVDVGHANIEGLEETKDPKLIYNACYLKKLKERIVQFHLHDNHGLCDEHLFPGEGTVDWKRFLQATASTGFDGTYVLEMKSNDNPIEAARKARNFLTGIYRTLKHSNHEMV